MTPDDFTTSLATETERAIDTARRSIRKLQDRLAEAAQTLDDAEANMPSRWGTLDIYGNDLTAVAKDCARASTLITLNAHAQEMEA